MPIAMAAKTLPSLLPGLPTQAVVFDKFLVEPVKREGF